jgi:hypothetical protein
MKVVPHWWREEHGKWEFDPNFLEGEGLDKVEIPDEVIERFKEADKRYSEACDEVGKYIVAAVQENPDLRVGSSVSCWIPAKGPGRG